MKKYFKFFLVALISGIVCTSIGVYATITYTASQIKYINSNNQEVTLDTALNELYNNVDKSPTFSDAKYSEILTTLSSSVRQQSIGLTKGRWIIAFVRSTSWSRGTASESTNTSNYNLICDSGNTVTNLTNKSYMKSGTDALNNGYITNRIYENMYYVEFNSNSGSCYVTYSDTTNITNAPEIITLQAIKIN